MPWDWQTTPVAASGCDDILLAAPCVIIGLFQYHASSKAGCPSARLQVLVPAKHPFFCQLACKSVVGEGWVSASHCSHGSLAGGLSHPAIRETGQGNFFHQERCIRHAPRREGQSFPSARQVLLQGFQTVTLHSPQICHFPLQSSKDSC